MRPLAAAGVVGWYIDASVATVPVNPTCGEQLARWPLVAAGDVSSRTAAGAPVASVARDRREVGQRRGRRGTVTAAATRNPAARNEARACASRACPSSLSSTAIVTCEPCAVPSSERRRAPHAGLTTLVCSAACAPTKPKPKRLASHAVVAADPTNGRAAPAPSAAGVEGVAHRGHDREHRRRGGRGIGRVARVLDRATGHSPTPVGAREPGLRADLRAGRRGIGADETADGDRRAGHAGRGRRAPSPRPPGARHERRRRDEQRERACRACAQARRPRCHESYLIGTTRPHVYGTFTAYAVPLLDTSAPQGVGSECAAGKVVGTDRVRRPRT